MTQPPRLSTYGAVDLGSLTARPAARPATATAGSDGGGAAAAVIDVTEATFQTEVLERSMDVPVVIDFWAEWCGPCKQLSPVLEKLAADDGGRWVLAKIDVDANQGLAGAAGVQGIPAVKAVVKGQLVHEFTGALPEAQVRQWLDAILDFATQNGVTGTVETTEPGGEAPAAPPLDPDLAAALTAIEAGDLPRAEAAYLRLLERSPGDPTGVSGLAQVRLVTRGQALDQAAVRAAAAERPADVAAACDAADLDLLGGHVEDAFARLVEAVRVSSGEDRDQAKAHLLSLFDALGAHDPRVLAGRRALAAALF